MGVLSGRRPGALAKQRPDASAAAAGDPLPPPRPTPTTAHPSHPLPPTAPPRQVPDIEAPGFWERMDRMVGYNTKLVRRWGGWDDVWGTGATRLLPLEHPTRWGGEHARWLVLGGAAACLPRPAPPHPLSPTLPSPTLLPQVEIDNSDAPEWLKKLQKLPYTERILAECLQLFFMPTKRTGSLDIEGAKGYLY